MKNAVELINISVKRRFRVILEMDRLAIPAGQFTGFIGPNGAGKTTLLKVCGGLLKPTRGTVHLQSKRIGYIPQQTEYNAHLPFTLREIVAMGRNSLIPLGRRLNKDDFEHVDFWIDRMGLYDRRSQPFRTLSGGQQQKTMIARAMAAQPDILLMDEPGANLDPAWKMQLKNILNQLFEEHPMTILLISHELELIPESCRRLVLLDNGHIAADGLRDEILNVSAARKIFDNTRTFAGEC